MKKNITCFLFVIVSLSIPLLGYAGVSYSSLWKKVSVAEGKDQPRTEIRLLQQIASKASVEAKWGHYIKAQLMMMQVWNSISADSLKPQFNKFRSSEVPKFQDYSPASAVGNAVLGCLYRDYYDALDIKSDSARVLSKECFDKALSDTALLARTEASDYEPLVIEGDASDAFDDDLLHIIGIEAGEYKLLSKWYKEHNNLHAACLSDFLQTQKERHEDVREIHRSFYLHTLDSLINEYRYLPEAGEIAIEKFNYMDQATDASAKEKIDYIENAVREWPTWKRMSVLRNAKTRIELPSFHVQLPNTVLIPDKPQTIKVTALKHISQLMLTVTKVNMTGAEEFNPRNEKDLKMIRNLMEKKPSSVDVRNYYGLPDYLEIRDTLTIDSLKPGVYLAEFTTDNSDIPTERILLHVSNLQLVDMDMPDKLVRLIVADATTGKPVSGATVDLRFSLWTGGKMIYENKTLTSDHNGEVAFTSNGSPISYRVSLNADNAMQWQHMGTNWRPMISESQKSQMLNRVDVFTDRSIYRPGQELQTSVLVSKYNRKGDASVIEGEQLRIILRDSKSAIDTILATTDEWGVATASFSLPQDIHTGYCSMKVEGMGNTLLQAWKTVRVEEYKKPTFTAYIDKYTDAYQLGDTIILRGHARSFTGVALQNAVVSYSINHSQQSDTLRTDQQGEFSLLVPMTMPDKKQSVGRRRAFVSVCAKITSLAGESHETSVSLPVADKPLMVVVNGLTDKVCLEHKPEVEVYAVNPAGKRTQDSVYVSGLEWTKGEHNMTAWCKGDTVSMKYVVFSLEDKQPQVKTPDWFYSCNPQPSSLNLQVGTSEHQQTVYYAIISEKKILEEGRFVIDSANVNRTFQYNEDWGDGLALRYSWVRDGKLYTHSASLSRPVNNDTLQLEWKTFRDHTQPGSKEQWTLRVKQPTASCHFMATMYDKSLDNLRKHSFLLNSKFSTLNTPNIYASLQNRPSDRFLFGEATYRPFVETQLEFSHLYLPELYAPVLSPMLLSSSTARTLKTSAMSAGHINSEIADNVGSGDLEVRDSNMDTAFWLPSAVTNENGEIQMKFQLPDNLTTWRFLGVAHDKQMHCGNIASEIIVQKALMVQPNMPRFLRQGDNAEITAQITNTTSKALSGNATFTLTDETTGKVVSTQKQHFKVDANNSTSITFSLNTSCLAQNTYICKIVAQSGRVSDGEQNRLCVISNKEQVVTTRAFTQTEPGVKTIDLNSLVGKNATDISTEVKYTDNPALLLLDALNNMKETNRDDAISLATAVFAETVKDKLNNNNLTLNTSHLTLLGDLQLSDGSFSWCPRMAPSRCITDAVTKILLRAQKISPSATCKHITDKAMLWLDKDEAECIARLKKDSEIPKFRNSEIPYLYLQTLQGSLTKQGRSNAKYCISKLSALNSQLSIYEKAQLAVVYAKHPEAKNIKKANELLNSIKEYAVSTPEMGTYFDTSKAGYSWFDYKIPTQTAVIEALQFVQPDDKTAIASMRQWLLQEKRTQQWSTPLNSSAAVYAFFGGDSKEATQPVEPTVIKVDGKKVQPGKLNHAAKKAEFDKKSQNISWGAVLVSSLQPVEDVEARGEDVTVRREYLDQQGNPTTLEKMNVGDRVKVRITVVTQRDLDFVEISDHRAACLEPASQLSGYHWGYYTSAKDKETIYYVQKLSKGKHQYTTEYYKDRLGSYQPGIVKATCTYAPEYSAYSK